MMTRHEVESIVYWERLAGRIPDLREVDLSGANLCGANLSEVDLEGANLRKADLSEVDLDGANLRKADLSGANLRGANLCVANLCLADLREANMREADLRSANLAYADLANAELGGAQLKNANLSEVNLRFASGSAIVGSERTISFQDKYRGCLVDDMLFIGCKANRVHEWFAFSDEEIAKMDSGALKWWRDDGWKKKLFHLIDAADFGIELE